MAAPATAYLGLGSNLGDRRAAIDRACALLAASPGLELRRRSARRESAPQGTEADPAGGGLYLNAVVEVASRLEPQALLGRCLEIEAQLGRVRAARNAPRPIDLDLLFYGDRVLDREASATGPALTLPHPRILERAFVLEPLAELAPQLRHPLSGRTMREHWEEMKAARAATGAGASTGRSRSG